MLYFITVIFNRKPAVPAEVELGGEKKYQGRMWEMQIKGLPCDTLKHSAVASQAQDRNQCS
jgi:hypothetical protein